MFISLLLTSDKVVSASSAALRLAFLIDSIVSTPDRRCTCSNNYYFSV